MENMDAQFALRGEHFGDIDDSSVVGKFAIGYEPIEQVKFRASTSTSFRAPNLITVNEGLIARSNTQEDPLYTYAVGENYENYSIQRVAQGNKDLKAEEATNTSIGVILMPGEQFPLLDGLIIRIFESGNAYWCDCSPETLEAMRNEQSAAGKKPMYDGRSRNLGLKRSNKTVLRLATPENGDIIVNDLIRGEIKFQNNELDDLILLRSDGTPTYIQFI